MAGVIGPVVRPAFVAGSWLNTHSTPTLAHRVHGCVPEHLRFRWRQCAHATSTRWRLARRDPMSSPRWSSGRVVAMPTPADRWPPLLPNTPGATRGEAAAASGPQDDCMLAKATDHGLAVIGPEDVAVGGDTGEGRPSDG